MSPVLSVRLPGPIEEKIRSMAVLERRSLAEMIRMLAEEALKQREFPEITFVNGPTGRRARLIHGADVWEVVEPYTNADRSWQALRESFPELDEAHIRTAVRYYDTYPEEIDARIALNQAE